MIWSAPGDGTGVSRILPAVPSPTGVADVFALQSSGNVQAITTDGSVAWTASVGTGNTLLPDFQGGLVVANYASIKKLDGITGQMTSQYNYVGAPQSNVALHTNGTIFAVDGTSLVGINSATGTPIFTIPLDQSTSDQSNACEHQPDTQSSSPPQTGQLIIAGDGNAYLIYQYTQDSTSEQLQSHGACNVADYDQLHLRLLQVDPSGNAQKIVIGDWSQASPTAYEGSPVIQDGQLPQLYSSSVNMVTNADQGVLLALQYSFPAYCSYAIYRGDPHGATGCVPAIYQRSFMTISGGSITSNSLLTVGNPEYGVIPILQGQDGTYFGVGLTTLTSMDAFDQNGNVKWSVPNFTPVIASADGGVIAQSATGQYMTFDQNGVANGMLATLPTYSWLGNAYQDGLLDQVAAFPVAYASSFLAMLGANNSGNGTGVQPNWYPKLQSCYDPTPVGNPVKTPIPCPGRAEIANSALAALRSLVQIPCLNCEAFVFSLLENVPETDQQYFSKRLNLPAGLYDGTTSNFPLKQMCTSRSWDGFWCSLDQIVNNATVADFFKDPNNGGTTNISQMPAAYGFLTFYDPFYICHYGTQGNALYNEAVLFHEALHGFYGMNDASLQEAFGLSFGDSVNITEYINNKVLGGSANVCGN